jgi:hypothetical protein
MMSDKVPMPAPGNPASKGAPDGVSTAPDAPDGQVHGRAAGGESGGAAYPNPHDETDDADGGRVGAISAPGTTQQAGDRTDNPRHRPAPVPEPDRSERTVDAPGGSFTVLDTSGVAQAETTGKVGTDAEYEAEQHQPGSG